jgi:chemotaxis protein methyltransferase CheR
MLSEQVDNFQSLADLISSRTALKLRDEDRENWLKTINSRLKSLKLSIEEYHQFLISDSLGSRFEWREIIGLLTTGETYFFRDKGQFALIRNWILPELIERRRDKRQLRIWSAGCSTGEEPYSMAIIVNELLPDSNDWDILIIGTDINVNAIEKAERGIYTRWSFRMVAPDLQCRYFHRRKDEWEVDAKIKEMVRFKEGNIVPDQFPDHASGIYDMDIILCRNVFIYFNEEAVSIALKKLTDTLSERGYLITGHGEIHGKKLESLRPVIFPESVIYQKSSELEVRSFELEKTERRERTEVRIQKPIPMVSKIPIPKPEVGEAKPRTPDIELKTLLDTAESYADAGEYDKAVSVCRKAIELDATAIKPYFLLAHIVEAKGDIEEAKGLLKKAIYLEPDFIPAYLELGAIYDNEGNSERAEKMRTAALDLLKALPSHEVIEPYKGITAGELARYVEKLADINEEITVLSYE